MHTGSLYTKYGIFNCPSFCLSVFCKFSKMNSHDSWIKENNKPMLLRLIILRTQLRPGCSLVVPGQDPVPHQLPPTHFLLPLGFGALKATASLYGALAGEGRELLMLLGGQWGDEPPVSPEPPVLTTQPSVFAVLIDEFTVGWIGVSELATTWSP